jgi:hypothetical protein
MCRVFGLSPETGTGKVLAVRRGPLRSIGFAERPQTDYEVLLDVTLFRERF